MGIKVPGPARYVREPDAGGTEKGLPEGDKLYVVSYAGLRLPFGVHDGEETLDLPGDREKAEIAPAHIHGVGEVAQLEVNVKGLGKEVDRVAVMPLELEVVTDIGPELLEITVVPDHADLIDHDDGTRRKGTLTDIIHVESPAAGDSYRGIYRMASPEGLNGELGEKRGLAGTLLPEDHDKLVRVTVTPSHVGEPDHGQKESQKEKKILHKHLLKNIKDKGKEKG